MAELTFEAPGPGTWNLGDTHYPRPVTRYYRELPHGVNTEWGRRGFVKYGYLHKPVRKTVNGFQYTSVQTVHGTPELNSDPVTLEDLPDDPENEFQRRAQNARETFETKRWRTDLERWDNEWKPVIRETNRKLQAISPTDLDDEELIEHLEACRESFIEHFGIIFRVMPSYRVPQGDFLAFVREHTDLPPDEIISLLAGGSPDSKGPLEELQALTSAIESTPDARELVFSENPPGDIIGQLREFDDDLGETVVDWLAVAGYRVMHGFDLDNQYALERPATLVNTLRTALNREVSDDSDSDESVVLEEIRKQVPAELRDTFDERYEEARLTYRVKDEREHRFLSTQGLLRRALLEAGRRLADRLQLRKPEHVVDLKPDEVIAALRGELAPSAAEVASHVRYRENHDASDAPDQLRSDDSSTTDLEQIRGIIDRGILPEASARVMSALFARGWANDSSLEPGTGEDNIITGHAASPGTVEGPARVIDGSEDFDKLQEGDILVAEMTNSSFNFVLPMLRGIVTDTGGMLSHPAIVAREFAIPGVVGCEDATDCIQDDDRIIVDGEEGTVRFAN